MAMNPRKRNANESHDSDNSDGPSTSKNRKAKLDNKFTKMMHHLDDVSLEHIYKNLSHADLISMSQTALWYKQSVQQFFEHFYRNDKIIIGAWLDDVQFKSDAPYKNHFSSSFRGVNVHIHECSLYQLYNFINVNFDNDLLSLNLINSSFNLLEFNGTEMPTKLRSLQNLYVTNVSLHGLCSSLLVHSKHTLQTLVIKQSIEAQSYDHQWASESYPHLNALSLYLDKSIANANLTEFMDRNHNVGEISTNNLAAIKSVCQSLRRFNSVRFIFDEAKDLFNLQKDIENFCGTKNSNKFELEIKFGLEDIINSPILKNITALHMWQWSSLLLVARGGAELNKLEKICCCKTFCESDKYRMRPESSFPTQLNLQEFRFYDVTQVTEHVFKYFPNLQRIYIGYDTDNSLHTKLFIWDAMRTESGHNSEVTIFLAPPLWRELVNVYVKNVGNLIIKPWWSKFCECVSSN